MRSLYTQSNQIINREEMLCKRNLLQNVRYMSCKVGVLGIPFDKGQPKIGVANGPACIRKAGLIGELQNIHQHMDIKDYGDVTYKPESGLDGNIPENMKKYEHIVACSRETSSSIQKIIGDGRICLSLGGDHSISIGTVDGHIKAKREVSLLWIDAHADLNTNKTSGSGNVHGMPLALLVRELSDYWPYLPGMDWQQPIISIRNIAYIGLRSVDVYERLVIDQLGITAFGMEDVEKYGINTVLNLALDNIDPQRNRSIHVSFDIDSLDSLEAPSTGTSVRGGLTLREGIHIMEAIQRTGRLGAMDLVEINPSIGTEKDVHKTIEAAIHVILAAFGHSRRGLRLDYINNVPFQTFPKKEQAS